PPSPLLAPPAYTPAVHGIVVTPIPEYGVNFYARCYINDCHAYLYKHELAAPDTTPPSAPGSLSAAAVHSARVDLSWSASSDDRAVSGYEVERCEGDGCTSFALVASPTGAAFSDTTVAASTTYRYRARARDAAGNTSGYSNIADATTPTPDTTAPSTPTSVGATAVSATQINVSWTASTDDVAVTGYQLERCQGVGCSSFALIGSPTGTAFSDTGRTASTSYSYRVRARDAAGNFSTYSVVASATTPAVPDTTAPTVPSGLNGSAAGPTQINLSWTASTDNVGVSGYQIDRCTGSGCTGFTQIGTSSTASFGDTGLAASTTYRYRVRATDGAG
ncbi:MAG TPA: fibronectin type III domain-containing protein, partial [Gammaproteobacteria bacterium]|nr:fibronectin type III domain-containing protein [Gammaproteobacteria bacterium]